MLSSTNRQPFKHTKKFRKSITAIEKKLFTGCLVAIRATNKIMLYIGKSKDKKTWHKKYYFLSQGEVITFRRSNLYIFQILNEDR